MTSNRTQILLTKGLSFRANLGDSTKSYIKKAIA
jgi:hypothetical protein